MDLKDLKKGNLESTDVDLVFGKDGEAVSGFKVLGSNSEQYQEIVRKWNLRNVKKTARRGRGVDAATDNGAAELVEQMAKREKEIVYGCIVGLYGFTNDGVPAELNAETLDSIFAARPTWSARVLAAIENEGLFTQG